MADQSHQTDYLKEQVWGALEELSFSFESKKTQETYQKLANLLALMKKKSHYQILKSIMNKIPSEFLSSWERFEASARKKHLLSYKGVPLIKRRLKIVSVLFIIITTPVIFSGFGMNFFPLILGWWAGRKFPDGENVISLWRILVGMPAFALWIIAIVIALIIIGHWELLFIYLFITVSSLGLYSAFKRVGVSLWNYCIADTLKSDFSRFQDFLFEVGNREYK